MNQIRKSIFIALLSVGIFSFPNSNIMVDEVRDSYGSLFKTLYKDGYVYIGNEEEYRRVKPLMSENDYFVLDERNYYDANMKVIDSYKIHDEVDQEALLEILLYYEQLYPSSWNRSLESMKLEWRVHNVLYQLHYEEHRTRDVDFNNADETKYSKTVLKRMLQ
ncbi:MAG: hypothetical protein IJ772_01840 [Bacilli bacterium]|nr:hypothetical protein [Bacilli bacterium]